MSFAERKSLIEAFELLAQSEQLLPRLDAAAAEIAKVESLVAEKSWIEIARQRLRAATEGTAPDLLLRALRLPDLESMRGDYSRGVQGAVVDALEHLHAAISLAGGARAALLEALYYKIKIPALRKCDREELEAFYADFEKRLKSTYAKRMLADPDYAIVVSSIEDFRRAYGVWKGIFVADPATGEEAAAVRAELEFAAGRLDVAGRQAKLLAQAALVPFRHLDAAELLALEKRRRGKEDEDNHPLLEQDPPDPRAPTADEQAEIESAR